MTDSVPKEIVIGIRYTLKAFKKQGLVEEDSLYAEEALSDINNQILSVAKEWYKIGAKRGANAIIEELLNGNLEVEVESDGSRVISAKPKEVSWTTKLKVQVGNSKKEINSQKYKLSYTDDLDFVDD